jgi:hypothetical protein
MGTSEVGTNIWNATSVVLETYRNVSKLLAELDIVASEEGFVSITPKSLRWRADGEPAGWLYWSFIKLFQRQQDPPHPQVETLRRGPVYVVDVDLFKAKPEYNLRDNTERPLLYLSRFVYDPNLASWKQLPGKADHWRFYWPVRNGDCAIAAFESHRVSIPQTAKDKKDYWGLERAVFTTIDLIPVNSRETIRSHIFQRLNNLPAA